METSHTHRTPIGFKNTNNKVEVYQAPSEPVLNTKEVSVEQMMKLKGYEQGWQILQEYFNEYMYPLLNGDQRDAFFIERLRKTRERFFTPI
ncbi:hypothetical protein [Flavobacterium sp.]|jgi:hypothetical protein|uniref:hypothetical protein n=1 Tax=Flavobacterium sp. TaxID=239 RepID=UPI00262EA91F|nr:hypothetical protein [Flavobacterium sp.]